MNRPYSGQAIARIKKRQELLDAINKENKERIVSLLVFDQVDPDHSVTIKFDHIKKTITPLIAAIDRERSTLVSLLLERGADINKGCGPDYHLPLFEAILVQNVTLVQMLLNQPKLDQRLTNRVQDSALIFACRNFEQNGNSLQIIQLLLDSGMIDPNHSNKFKRTALFYVCTQSLAATEYLLDAGANTNIADICGDTPLLCTLRRFVEITNTKRQAELLQMVTRMLQKGADPDHRNKLKMSARSLCNEHELSFILPAKKETVL